MADKKERFTGDRMAAQFIKFQGREAIGDGRGYPHVSPRRTLAKGRLLLLLLLARDSRQLFGGDALALARVSEVF